MSDKTYTLKHGRGWYGFCDNGPCTNELRIESGSEVVLEVTLPVSGGNRRYCSETCMRVIDHDARPTGAGDRRGR